MIVACILGWRVMPLPIPWEAFTRCLVATLFMAIAVWSLPPIGGLPELMLDAAIGGLVYAVAALILNAAGVRDLVLRLYRNRMAKEASA
jgi:hypothetical protein